MKFSALVSKVAFILADEVGVVYDAETIRMWLIEAESVIVSLATSANPKTITVAAVQGTRQSIPETGVRLLAVNTVGGRAVRMVERGAKDDADPYWRNETAGSVASEYILDARMPREFDVSPPVLAGTPITLSFDDTPEEYDFDEAPDPDITIQSIYSAAMVDYAAYRCLSRADVNTPEWTKAAQHYKTFMEKIGGKTQLDVAQSPKQGGFLR